MELWELLITPIFHEHINLEILERIYLKQKK